MCWSFLKEYFYLIRHRSLYLFISIPFNRIICNLQLQIMKIVCYSTIIFITKQKDDIYKLFQLFGVYAGNCPSSSDFQLNGSYILLQYKIKIWFFLFNIHEHHKINHENYFLKKVHFLYQNSNYYLNNR